MTVEKEIREPVMWFAQQMEAKLKENDNKGGWDDCNTYWLYERLKDELIELLVSIEFHYELGEDSNDIIKESADVANFAMMIADIARKRTTEATE